MYVLTDTILSTFMSNNQLHISQFTQLCKVFGPLMKPKPKLLAYRNVVTKPIVMPECGDPITF